MILVTAEDCSRSWLYSSVFLRRAVSGTRQEAYSLTAQVCLTSIGPCSASALVLWGLRFDIWSTGMAHVGLKRGRSWCCPATDVTGSHHNLLNLFNFWRKTVILVHPRFTTVVWHWYSRIHIMKNTLEVYLMIKSTSVGKGRAEQPQQGIASWIPNGEGTNCLHFLWFWLRIVWLPQPRWVNLLSRETVLALEKSFS